MGDFSRQKIIYPGLMRITKSNPNEFPRFYLDEKENFALTNDSYFITGNDIEYLFPILNSKLTRFMLPFYIYSFDETGFKVFTDFFDKMPIVKCADIELSNRLISLSKQIIINKHEISKIEKQINSVIYTIYSLNNEEIEFIESR